MKPLVRFLFGHLLLVGVIGLIWLGIWLMSNGRLVGPGPSPVLWR